MAFIPSAIILFAAVATSELQGSDLSDCLPESGCIDDLAAARLFDLAENYAAAGDVPRAEGVLRELRRHPLLQIRSEARFRLAMLLAKAGRLKDAALLLRQILDEDSKASRVRLELARLLEQLGDESGARRALREAQAGGGLPPEVALLVDRYSAALRARKTTGAALEIAIAPDSNINRATRSGSLGTIFGDLTLDRDAQETSGIGLALRGQAHGRARLSPAVNLLGKIAGSADIYRAERFNDVAVGISAGPEVAIGSARLNGELGALWRWRGNAPFSRTIYVGANYLRPIDRRSQLRVAGAVGSIDNQLNDLQDGRSYGFSVSYERALSARAGIGVTLLADREKLHDSGYSTKSGQISMFGYRDMGIGTVTATLSYRRLEADTRLLLYPDRRKENLYRASIAATFRKFAIAGFAPLVRITAERNHSSLTLFDYQRLRGEMGIVRAF